MSTKSSYITLHTKAMLLCRLHRQKKDVAQSLATSMFILSVVNMPRCDCYSQVRIAIQLDKYQKDSGAAWWADTRQTGEFPMFIYDGAGVYFLGRRTSSASIIT
jgi:hypothetical protein